MADYPEANFFANELHQYYLEHGISLSPEIMTVLSKVPLELTDSEKALFVKFVLPRRHQIKQALRTRFTRSGADQPSWIESAASCSQSIIGQIAGEMLIEDEIMALGPGVLTLPVMAGPLSAPKIVADAPSYGEAPTVKERRERPKPERQPGRHQVGRIQNLQSPPQLDAVIPTIRPEQSGSSSSPLFGPNIRKGSKTIRKKRRAAVYVVVAGIGVLALLLAGFLFFSRGRGDGQTGIRAAAVSRIEKAADLTGPTIGIIVEDAGENIDNLDQWSAIDAPLTFSILPRTSHSEGLSLKLYKAGYRIMMNVPTEGSPPYQISGEGQISGDMDQGTVFRVMDDDLTTVPQASGINNHEGQVGCADLQLMIWQAQWAKANNRFIVDSRTAKYSMVLPAAEALNVDRKYNQVFIDEHNDPDFIRVAMQRLANLAKSNGVAIGICSFPRSNTPATVGEMIKTLRQQGIHFAFVQDLHN